VALVSVHAVRGDVASGRLRALRRHCHVIHNEARTLSASARAFLRLLDAGRTGIAEPRGGQGAILIPTKCLSSTRRGAIPLSPCGCAERPVAFR
jgi:hypothetical protein